MEPQLIPVPAAAAVLRPKQIILLMRGLGVGKRNHAPPRHARAWTTAEFLDACTREEVVRGTRIPAPERTTVENWFSPSGPVPDDRRASWHYFFHVFFCYERRAFGTLLWKEAYFDAVRRAKIDAVTGAPGAVPLDPLPGAEIVALRPFLERRA